MTQTNSNNIQTSVSDHFVREEEFGSAIQNSTSKSSIEKPPSVIVLRSALLRSGFATPVEIEMRFVAGLPGILFLGLPDTSLKETAIRLKSALRAANYEIPRGKQLLVDISPRDEKKTARGLDLAVCVGFLILTGQISNIGWSERLIYGDVRLGGDIVTPADWQKAMLLADTGFVSGAEPIELSGRSLVQPIQIFSVATIADLKKPLSQSLLGTASRLNTSAEGNLKIGPSISKVPRTLGPQTSELRFTKAVARTAALMALGGHPGLFAGPPGTGKSTLARVIHSLRPSPTDRLSREMLISQPQDDGRLQWGERPLMEPHHTTSELAMIGGGRPVRAGIVTRSHGGTLLLDEVMLFRPEVQESLREPIETGVVKIARGSELRSLPADFQLIGTTNLCACGKYTPERPHQCRCSSRVRAKFEERLRGPFVDRFQVLVFTDDWRARGVDIEYRQIATQVAEALKFQNSRGRHIENSRWFPTDIEIEEIVRGLNRNSQFLGQHVLKLVAKATSERRRLSLFRVARTLADLDHSSEIHEAHIQEAAEYAIESFEALQSGSGLPWLT